MSPSRTRVVNTFTFCRAISSNSFANTLALSPTTALRDIFSILVSLIAGPAKNVATSLACQKEQCDVISIKYQKIALRQLLRFKHQKEREFFARSILRLLARARLRLAVGDPLLKPHDCEIVFRKRFEVHLQWAVERGRGALPRAFTRVHVYLNRSFRKVAVESSVLRVGCFIKAPA